MKFGSPIKFTPIMKEKVWGGNKLKRLFKKASLSSKVGESWEISGVEGALSVVANGEFIGKSIHELIEIFKQDLLGKQVYAKFGNQFPLLFKFIDAKEKLSIQLHPNDTLAKSRHNSFGKTEMWYIVQADKNANLIIGFKEKFNEKMYQQHLDNGTLEELLHYEKVKEGDAFYITPGRIHAIGAGVLLAEIQQTSDITYRLYDWNRPDSDGKLRELHNDLALDAIDFSVSNEYRLEYHRVTNHPQKLIASPYFETSFLEVHGKIDRDLSLIDSFVVYMCVAGEGIIRVNTNSQIIQLGETVLIPAICTKVSILATNAKLLEVFVPPNQ